MCQYGQFSKIRSQIVGHVHTHGTRCLPMMGIAVFYQIQHICSLFYLPVSSSYPLSRFRVQIEVLTCLVQISAIIPAPLCNSQLFFSAITLRVSHMNLSAIISEHVLNK